MSWNEIILSEVKCNTMIGIEDDEDFKSCGVSFGKWKPLSYISTKYVGD